MTREQKIDIMLEAHFRTCRHDTGYLWDDIQEAVEMAFRKIERVEQAEIEEPQTGGAVRDSSN